MNLKIIDKVKKSFCKHKKTIKGIVIAVIALLSVYSFMLPFSDGFHTALLRTKILGIGSTICGIVFFIIVIITTLKNAKKDKKYYYDILCASPLMLLEIVNIFMIFDCGFLGFKTIIVGISLISVLLIEIFISIRALFHNSFGKEFSPVLLLTLAVTSCLFSLANISSGNLGYAKIFAEICFGCAYLVAIALYTNKLIYTPKNPEKTVNTIICFIFWGAFITITFPFYVQWCGLTGDNFNTFISVYAAVIGGALTLVGVAWTIKDGNDKRKEDLDRVEMERKEEERKKNIPYIKSVDDVLYDSYINIPLKNHYDFCKIEDRSKFTNKQVYSVQFSELGIKNVSDTHIIFNSIALNNRFYSFSGILIEKGQTCKITFNNNSGVVLHESLNSIKLIMCDMVGNSYEIECKYAHSQNTPPQAELETTDDGVDYTLHARSYIIQKVSLPEHIKKEFEHE